MPCCTLFVIAKHDIEDKREETVHWFFVREEFLDSFDRQSAEVLHFQSINQSINQSEHICIAPNVANESEANLSHGTVRQTDVGD